MLIQGDCLERLVALEPNSIDALITDPPAGISFMGKEWDDDKGGRKHWITWMTEVMTECLRVMKPGAYGLVWALPRTSHWTATALEDAGFEVRDVVTHLFGTGFPKSLNLGEGRGTALKPASEHWILIRRPISEKTVAANVLKWGCGGLNIDGCRVATTDTYIYARTGGSAVHGGGMNTERSAESNPQGRFPANLILDEEAAQALDEQSGVTKSGDVKAYTRKNTGGYSGAMPQENTSFHKGDSGGASRFFYVAKASKSDKGADNSHPTVKSTKLMEYLIKLITPPNGVVLDPFAGSGSTCVAAKSLGFHFIGIEKDEHYIEIAKRRLG